ncbi:MAG: CRISPR-associated protein Csx20 [Thermodesulfobacteriota bacterium]|nr:CRISPR-associated protein Csx20 [Thermodesulfobacteriota bacterium]
MSNLFLIFNHEITSVQESDAYSSLGVREITDLPLHLKELWRQIPPNLAEIKTYLWPVKTWLEQQAAESDYVLIQGDFGACYIMVNYAFEIGVIPIYSTTTRDATEEYDHDGSVRLIHQFKHQTFRRYGV